MAGEKAKKQARKEQVGVKLPSTLKKQVKHLSVDTDKPLQELFEEAVKDLLIKYTNKKNNKKPT